MLTQLRLHMSDRLYKGTPPGVVMGLAWTANGGATLYVEARGGTLDPHASSARRSSPLWPGAGWHRAPLGRAGGREGGEGERPRPHAGGHRLRA